MHTNQSAGFIRHSRQDALKNYCKMQTAAAPQPHGAPRLTLNPPGFVITDALCYGCTNRPNRPAYNHKPEGNRL